MQALRWLAQAVNLGVRNPRAIFGAAVLAVMGLYSVLLLGTLLTQLGAGGGVNTLSLSLLLFTMIGVLLLVPVLLGGLMHVIAEAEAGRPVRARDVFMPFVRGMAGKLAAFGSLQLVLMLLGGVVSRQLMGDAYMQAYNEAINLILQGQQPEPLPPPAHPLWLFFWQMALSYVNTMLMLLGVAQVVLSGCGFVAAAKGALRAALRNVLPCLILLAVCCIVIVPAGLVLALLGLGLLWLMTQIFAPLAMLLGVLLVQVALALVLVLACGLAYLMWRDMFAGDAPGEDAPHHVVV